jgi:hypothetical protein
MMARRYQRAKTPSGREHPRLVLVVKVHAADITNRDSAPSILDGMLKRFPCIRKLWTDSSYNGRFHPWAAEHLPWDVEIVKHWWTGIKGLWVAPDQEPPTIPSGFHVLPKR